MSKKYESELQDEFVHAPKEVYVRNKKISFDSENCTNCDNKLYVDEEGLLEICSNCGTDPYDTEVEDTYIEDTEI
jgi:hypothetical protein